MQKNRPNAAEWVFLLPDKASVHNTSSTASPVYSQALTIWVQEDEEIGDFSKNIKPLPRNYTAVETIASGVVLVDTSGVGCWSPLADCKVSMGTRRVSMENVPIALADD